MGKILRKIYTGVDLIKLVAAICIVAIHTSMPFFNILGRLGVPFFTIVTSFFFFKKYIKESNFINKKKIIILYCKRILFLYLAWQLIYIPLAVKHFIKIINTHGGVSSLSLSVYIIDFFFPAIFNSKNVNMTYDANGWGPSWYLLAVLVGIPIFVLILKLFKKNKIAIGIILGLLELYFIIINEFNFINHYSPALTHTFLRLLIYFYVGYLFALYKDRLLFSKQKCLCLFILFAASFYFENILIHFMGGIYTSEEVFTTLPTSIALFLLAVNIFPNISKSIYIRNMSTFIYCIQIWPIEITRKLLSIVHLEHEYIILFVIVLFIIAIDYYVYTLLLRKTNCKYLKYLV